MQFVLTLSQSQANLSTTCSPWEWSAGYDIPQKLGVTVTAENGETGQVVGLTQTLTRSDRIAGYQTGGQLNILPTHNAPILDAEVDTEHAQIPWYNQFCWVALGAPGSQMTLTLQDQPVVNVPRCARDPHGNPQEIERLLVVEAFLVSLRNHTTGATIAQWTWGYRYVLGPANHRSHAPVILEHHEGQMEAVPTPFGPYELLGPVATEDPKKFWQPDGWSALDYCPVQPQ